MLELDIVFDRFWKGAGATMDEADVAALERLLALPDNDLLIERFFGRAEPVTEADARGLYALMELADNELLDIFLGRQKPNADL
ncbi:MAG TPA: succinate dehydrogenase assembly factor 2, partial [Usitatibacter sp.]